MSHFHSQLIVSTCGTSLLTNGTTQAMRTLLLAHTNLSQAEFENLETSAQESIEAHIEARRAELLKANEEVARRMCAELNGLMAILRKEQEEADYQASHRGPTTTRHILLATDTYAGFQTAQMVKAWLEHHVPEHQVELRQIRDLQTRDSACFASAMSEMARFAGSELSAYRKSGFFVSMNLTGGFKSVNGVLQSLGMLYADEVVYLFEGAGNKNKRTGSELIRIPRLPVVLDHGSVFREHLASFRLMAECGQSIAAEALRAVPRSLLLEVDGECVLSVWGEALWQEFADEHYRTALLDSPLPESIKYGPKFLKSLGNLRDDRLRTINKTIDQLARHYLSHGAYNPPSLDFKAFKGKPYEGSTHECDLWASNGGYRLFMHLEKTPRGEQVYVIDTMHTGLH